MSAEVESRKKKILALLKPHVVGGSLTKRNKMGDLQAYVLIKNDLCAKLLAFNHPNQRKKSKDTVDKYATDQSIGCFEPKTVWILFDEEYYLVNGQHTLSAMAISGVEYILKITVEATKRMIYHVEEGKKRKLRDRKRMDGDSARYVERRAALARILYGREVKGTMFSAVKPTLNQVEWIVDHNPLIGEAVDESYVYSYEGRAFLAPRDASLCYYLAAEKGEKALELGKEYLRKVATGNDVRDSDPARAVRISLQNGHHMKVRHAMLPGEPRHKIFRWRAILLLGLQFTIQKRRKKVIKLGSYKPKGENRVVVCENLDEFFKGNPLEGLLLPPDVA